MAARGCFPPYGASPDTHTQVLTRSIHRVYSPCMSTSQALLTLLEREPAYGYTLKRDYDQWFAQRRPLAFGQVYATLGRLERRGFAELTEVQEGQGPERRLYGITEKGVKAVDEWVFTPESPELFASSSLCARLTAALLSGRDAAQVVAGQRESHLHRMREVQRLRRDAAGADLLTLTYELAHLDADLRWLDESQQRLASVAGDLAGRRGSDERTEGGSHA